jgi:nitrogen fixation/metabolism regulation signal transduction histidine kinase
MFGFDGNGRLQLINDSGRRLLNRTDEEILGCRAEDLGLAGCLGGETPRVLDGVFPGGAGRWELRRGSYRDKGVPHELVFLSDLTRTLHEEERRAWKRLIRTVRHEVNNSLTPIQSVAESLRVLVGRQPLPGDWQEDVKTGLELIAERAEALDRFTGAYSRLMHLPQPSLSPVDVARLLRRVADLETRMEVTVLAGPETQVRGDRDQLEQLLINVVSNAVEASLQARPAGDGRVLIGWRSDAGGIEIHVDDDGPAYLAARTSRALFHHERPRLGNRPDAQPSNRRSPRRLPDPGKPRRPARLPRLPPPARIEEPVGQAGSPNAIFRVWELDPLYRLRLRLSLDTGTCSRTIRRNSEGFMIRMPLYTPRSSR